MTTDESDFDFVRRFLRKKMWNFQKFKLQTSSKILQKNQMSKKKAHNT